MSWDNVKGVSAAKIWTDNPDMTQAYLFANGNHQVKLTVAISFVLSNTTESGPTEDEVKAAITLIDYQTSAGLSHLKTGDKGTYAAVYQPNSPVAIKAVEDSNTGAYQYEFDYYISSDSTINASYMSEEVALLISYTGSDGKPVSYSTASGSKSQSSVKVTVEPPKKYGTSVSNLMPIIFDTIDDQFHVEPTWGKQYISQTSTPTASTYAVRIDDSYFRISYFKTSNTPVSPYAFLQHTLSNDSGHDDYAYEYAHSFLLVNQPQYNKINNYDINLYIQDSTSENLVQYSGKPTQGPGVILFVRIHCSIEYYETRGTPLAESSGPAIFTVYDQFGNTADVTVKGDSNGNLSLDSVL